MARPVCLPRRGRTPSYLHVQTLRLDRAKWPAVGRELAKLPGVRRGKVWIEGQRLTVYEIGPVSETASNVLQVVPQTTERKRA